MTQLLKTKAIEYLKQGIIVIPVIGKVAQISYADLTVEAVNIDSWPSHDGIAMLTGQNSRTLCLDIDNPELYAILSEEKPELLATFTEKTPRGYHLYYSTAESDKNIIKGRKWSGVDLLYGNYAVCSPTPGYSILDEKPIKNISLLDYLNLCQYLDKNTSIIEIAQIESAGEAVADNTKFIKREKDLEQREINLLLQTVYHDKRKSLGRNDSLFQSASYARDLNIALVAAAKALVYDFVYDKPSESWSRREREFKATIRSAYKYQTRQRHQKQLSLSDSTREKLFQLKLTNVVRTLDGLYSAGYQAGETITRRAAWEILRGIVGRDSIYAALDAIVPLSAPYPPVTDVAIENIDKDKNKCIFVRVEKSGKTLLGGRPEYEYTIPDPEEVAQILGADNETFSTKLTKDDLSSAKTTRQKLHFSLIDRKPGIYTLKWLADRLGLIVDTIRNYNKELNIYGDPQFEEYPLNRFNLDILEDIHARFPNRSGEIMGVFIRDIYGKKYPPKAAIAEYLLDKKMSPSLVWQTGNYYSTQKPEMRPNLRERAMSSTQSKPRQEKRQNTPIQRELPTMPEPKPISEIANSPLPHAAQTGLTENELFLMQWQHEMSRVCEHYEIETYQGLEGLRPPKHKAIKQHINHEVESVQAIIPSLSTKNIERLITQYGFKKVYRVSQFVSKRENVVNQAGLAISILKSEGKFSCLQKN